MDVGGRVFEPGIPDAPFPPWACRNGSRQRLRIGKMLLIPLLPFDVISGRRSTPQRVEPLPVHEYRSHRIYLFFTVQEFAARLWWCVVVLSVAPCAKPRSSCKKRIIKFRICRHEFPPRRSNWTLCHTSVFIPDPSSSLRCVRGMRGNFPNGFQFAVGPTPTWSDR